jgi:hypothetical protein
MMPPRFAVTARKAGHLTLASNHGDVAHLFVLEDDIIRFLVLPEGRLDQPRTFAMAYTDAPDAQARMAEFLERCAKHDILCDSFHLSSGYTSIGDRRNVFTWNKVQIPGSGGVGTELFGKRRTAVCQYQAVSSARPSSLHRGC